MNDKKISNLGYPSLDKDATTKFYVDTSVNSLSQAINSAYYSTTLAL